MSRVGHAQHQLGAGARHAVDRETRVDEPRPFRTVKEMVRQIDLEGMALAMLRDLQAEVASEAKA